MADPKWEAAYANIRIQEGGFCDRAADRGGPTNRGITQATYDKYRDMEHLPRQSVKHLSDAETEAIYLKWYYGPAQCDKMLQDLAIVHMDSAVNHGVPEACILLQRTLGVKEDGLIGPQTLVAVGQKKGIVKAYIDVRRAFYQAIVRNDPAQKPNLRGWLNRMDDLQHKYA